MTQPSSLRKEIAEPLLQLVTKLRPLAMKDSAYVIVHNTLCDVLDEFDNKLTSRTGNGLGGSWSKILKRK